MLVPMVKVAVVGHRSVLDDTIEVLHDLAVLHVLDTSAAPALRVGPMTLGPARAEALERARTLRTRIDALSSLRERAGIVSNGQEAEAETLEIDRLADTIAALLPRAEALAERMGDLEGEQEALVRHLGSLRQLAPLASELVDTASYETVAMVIDRQHADILDALRREADEITRHRYEMTTGVVDRDTVGALLVFPRTCSTQIHALLGGGRVSRVRLPAAYEGLPFSASLERMSQRLDDIPDEVGRLQNEIAELFAGELDWKSARRQADRRIARIELLRRLGSSERTFTAVGWIPVRDLQELERCLAERAGPKTMVTVLDQEPEEEPPVLMSNPPLAQPFEGLVKLFGWPRPKGIDPSGLMSVFMPLFFGMMLGDIGYGVVLLGLALYARRRFEEKSVGHDIARILALGAAWSIVWGALFGELFGDLGERWLHLHALWLPRGEAHAIGPLLTFALSVGAAHITLGLVLGLVTAWRNARRDELVERGGLLVAMMALFSMAGIAADALPHGLMTPSIAALVVGTVLVGVTKGSLGLLMGPLEVISGIGNVLSYLRIAAIGLASVYLARVANELAAHAPAVLGALVATLLHALNLALGAFSPTIQALRLHYVEFFGKFYDQGGTPYAPFGAELRRDSAAH